MKMELYCDISQGLFEVMFREHKRRQCFQQHHLPTWVQRKLDRGLDTAIIWSCQVNTLKDRGTRGLRVHAREWL
jgi:hypothetical protein